MRKFMRLWVLVTLGLLVAFLAGLVVVWPHLESNAPVLSFSGGKITHIGKKSRLQFSVRELGKGLAQVKVTLSRGNREKVLLNKEYPAASIWAEGSSKAAGFNLLIEPVKLGFKDGPAKLTMEARDHSWRGWFHGNLTRKTFNVTIDTNPPRLAVRNGRIYLNRGGAGMAVYTTSPDTVRHGVSVGARDFPGHAPWTGKPAAKLCLFAFAHNEDRNAAIKVWAEDAAGNRSEAPLLVTLKWKPFKQDVLNISDRFLAKILPRFADGMPASLTTPVEKYVWVNTKLRAINNATAKNAVRVSAPRQIWNAKSFRRPLGALRASFGDRRRYINNKKVISRAVHLGQDIASTSRADIKVAAAGKVVFAQPMGIYGNCIIVDHGLGVASLYGHLSTMGVSLGQRVERGQVIGQSGETGLAGGDHLHFSMLVGGVFVNPKEWWDPHWIRDNVDHHFKTAGLARPLEKGGAPPQP